MRYKDQLNECQRNVSTCAGWFQRGNMLAKVIWIGSDYKYLPVIIPTALYSRESSTCQPLLQNVPEPPQWWTHHCFPSLDDRRGLIQSYYASTRSVTRHSIKFTEKQLDRIFEPRLVLKSPHLAQTPSPYWFGSGCQTKHSFWCLAHQAVLFQVIFLGSNKSFSDTLLEIMSKMSPNTQELLRWCQAIIMSCLFFFFSTFNDVEAEASKKIS